MMRYFDDIKFDTETLENRFREMAFLNKGIKISLKDERDESSFSFHYEGGIKSFVDYLNKNRNALHNDVIYNEKRKDGNIMETAIQYTDSYTENVLTFANNIHTTEGGYHLSGFRTALTRALNDYGRKFGRAEIGRASCRERV